MRERVNTLNMYVYNYRVTVTNSDSNHRKSSYKSKRRSKAKLNNISGAGVVTTTKRLTKLKHSEIKKKKNTCRRLLVRKNIEFLKSLGLKVKK